MRKPTLARCLAVAAVAATVLAGGSAVATAAPAHGGRTPSEPSGSANYIVTLNPPREIPRDKVLYETTYHHPLYTAAAVDTHALLPLIQARRGIAWAGAWCGYGFHEDGLKAGLQAVQALDPACLPPWATGLAPAPARAPALEPGGSELPEPAV